MYDHMRALEDRFAPKPNHKRRQELEAKRQEVSTLLDKQGRKKLLHRAGRAVPRFGSELRHPREGRAAQQLLDLDDLRVSARKTASCSGVA